MSKPAAHATISWDEAGERHSAYWQSEAAVSPPKRLVVVDDTITADAAYRLACEGTAMLWRGDFQNARQLLQAMGRRGETSKKSARAHHKAQPSSLASSSVPLTRAALPSAALASTPEKSASAADAFHRHRLAQSQRARTLGMLLIQMNADYTIPLRRAPDIRQACAEVYGAGHYLSVSNKDTGPTGSENSFIVSLRELLGLIGAHEWRKNGVVISGLALPQALHIHPHYGVFSPVRGEYIQLVASAPLPATDLAFDIGTGSGILAAVLARRGIQRIVATDQDARALACATDNISRLQLSTQVEIIEADLFPPAEYGRAGLIVCNPPWLPARPSSPIEYAIYDPDSRMLLGFINGLAAHLASDGEGWLILSDFAEHLGLRSRQTLLDAIANAGLKVVGKHDIKPQHPKSTDTSDPLHQARAAEITSLWRLALQ